MGCSLNSNTETWHFAKPLPQLSNRIDIEYLKALVTQGYQGKKSTCTYIGHSTSTRKKCGMYILYIYSAYAKHIGYDHPQGQGRVKYYNKCKAQWDLYIPFNMSQFPFTCLVAQGIHSHHPPQPTRLPIEIANDFKASLQQSQEGIATMTPREHIFGICHVYANNILRALSTNSTISMAFK
jgi:hypothetical protein